MFVNAGGTKKARAKLNLYSVSYQCLHTSELFEDLHPISGCGQADTLCTVLQREYLAAVNPGDRRPSQAV
jgi:hypothetical protein